MALAMLPAELAEVTDPLRTEDELLIADELGELSIFEEVKKTPSFQRFPGTTVLRKCHKGRALVRQGDSGATAFSILSTEDVIELRENQVKSLTAAIEAKEAKSGDGPHMYYAAESVAELKQILKQHHQEVAELKQKLSETTVPPEERHVATAHLLLSQDSGFRPGLLHRLGQMFSGASKSRKKDPTSIPIDGPADIDGSTKQAPLHESELFGEMSCMNRAPRSATVVAEEDCYMLEMLRNVLDMLHSDPTYKKKLDEVYRARVLDGHVRRLPIFDGLEDKHFAEVKDRIELVEFEAGAVVFEEHESPDSFYVVRSGLVKIVKNAWTLFRVEEFKPDHWKNVWKSLADSEEQGLGAQVWGRLPDDVQSAAKDAAKNAPGADMQKALVDSLNEIVRSGDLHKALGKTTEEICVAVDSPQLAVDCEHFPTDTGKWSELETRTFHRSLIEFLYPQGIPARAASSGARKTLRYMGRGEGFGELGVVTEELRSATIFAYDHPDGGANQRLPDSRTGAIPSRVELVKMSREDFLLLTSRSAALKKKVDGIVADYQRQAKIIRDTINDRVEVRSQSPEFEQLGLIQGQKLMLIDLDRCTRCGQCVDACVAAHDDGRTRLYLDGPRFEKYLVPLSCRSCMDPVCMIGCPVGSINRGDNGEIEIRDWCIGCSLCADQCPYGSIQMNALEGGLELTASQQALLGGEDIKTVNERAVVCDLCSSLPSQSPSCVYACPHDAAMRVNSLEFFFEHTG
ncbi:MAG: Fe-S-cluster-containing hydrogenase component 2/CRP-like cAMP-binding protein [Planctomycetaceae bacterium]|jgi:Fe-S-cluster-containing hydrogenase component 2/CRP-like cAMP-binding protein